MKNRTHNFFSALLVAGLFVAGSTVQAQNKKIGAAVQSGNGAYVQKTDRTVCMTNSLLGLSALPGAGCLNMTQEKFIVTPSGNSSAIWRGTVPEGQRPTQRVVYNSTYVEVAEGPTKGLTYNTVATTEPSGAVTLTFDRKPNGKGKK